MGTAGVAEITSQLGLYSWQDGSDFYNHTQLAYNWDTIDSELVKKQWSKAGDTAYQIQFGTAAGSAIILGSATGDSYQRFEINAAGTVKWGSGGTVTDTNLYRAGSSVLSTDSIFRVSSGTLQFSSGTISFVGNADKISTNNIFSITRPASGTSILIGTGTYAKFKVTSEGNLSWGAGASDAYDVELSRSGSGTVIIQSGGSPSLTLSANSMGFFGSSSVQSTGWGAGPNNVSSGTKTYNAGSATLSQISHTLGNVIIALRNHGILGA